MLNIKVLGPGCANCRNPIALIQQVAQARGARSRVPVATWKRLAATSADAIATASANAGYPARVAG